MGWKSIPMDDDHVVWKACRILEFFSAILSFNEFVRLSLFVIILKLVYYFIIIPFKTVFHALMAMILGISHCF